MQWQNDMICSMSRTGVPYDNACAETFFSTIKMEMIYQEHFITRMQAQTKHMQDSGAQKVDTFLTGYTKPKGE